MSWTCPHCGIVATLQAPDRKRASIELGITTSADEDGIVVESSAVRCPSANCGKFCLDVWAHFGMQQRYSNSGGTIGARTGTIKRDNDRPVGIGHSRFEPRIQAPLSATVPKAVKEDYEEACLIRDLSPKAAATLCRRALQGMVRNFWGVSKRTLAEELEAIQSSCDPDIYGAMMGLKGVGNIGAHPERNINLIIEVEEGEVDTLLELLRILDKEWYVAKTNRASRLSAVVALGASKAAAKIGSSAGASPGPPSEI